MTETRTLVLIPARMAATRLPGKPLLDIGGVPMIVHVLRRAEAANIGRVAVNRWTTTTPLDFRRRYRKKSERRRSMR